MTTILSSPLQLRQRRFRYLRHDAHLRVDQIRHVILHREAHDYRRFGRIELVITLEPASQIRRRALQRLVERASDTDRHQILGILGSRRPDRFSRNDIDRELELHRGLERGSRQLAVTLRGVAVPQPVPPPPLNSKPRSSLATSLPEMPRT